MSVPEELLIHARELRKSLTDAEQLIWYLLRGRRLCGHKFRRQHPVGCYIVDFYCHEKCLAVELDGGGHADDRQEDYDAERSEFLKDSGVQVVRFWNHDVLCNTEAVLEEIFRVLNKEN